MKSFLEEIRLKLLNKVVDNQEIIRIYNHCKKSESYTENAFILALSSQSVKKNTDKNLIIDLINLHLLYIMKVEDESLKAELYYGLFLLYYHLDYAPKIIEYALKYEQNKNVNQGYLYIIYNILSIELNEVKMFEKALFYAKKSFEISKKISNKFGVLLNVIEYNNSFFLYMKSSDFEIAEKYLEKLEKTIEENPTNEYIELVKKSTQFIDLYFNIFNNEKNKPEYFQNYVTYMRQELNNTNNEFIKSTLHNIEIIELLAQNGFNHESIEILETLLESSSSNRHRRLIYILLLKCLENIPVKTDYLEAKMNHFEKDYLKELELYISNYDFMVKDLMHEQFRIFNLEHNYKIIQQNSLFDTLTGCFNRYSFENNGVIFLNTNSTGCLVFIDLDKLKYINDTYGHLIGDEVLKELAKVILCKIKDKADLYRYAGDEFIILSPLTSQETISLLDEIHKELEEPILIKNFSLKIDFTYGITSIFKNCSLQDLVAISDEKMYKNKKMKK